MTLVEPSLARCWSIERSDDVGETRGIGDDRQAQTVQLIIRDRETTGLHHDDGCPGRERLQRHAGAMEDGNVRPAQQAAQRLMVPDLDALADR